MGVAENTACHSTRNVSGVYASRTAVAVPSVYRFSWPALRNVNGLICVVDADVFGCGHGSGFVHRYGRCHTITPAAVLNTSAHVVYLALSTAGAGSLAAYSDRRR